MATENKQIDLTKEFEKIFEQHHSPEARDRERFKNNRQNYGYKETL